MHVCYWSGTDVAVCVEVENDLFAVGNPGGERVTEIIDKRSDGFSVGTLSAKVFLVLNVDSAVGFFADCGEIA